MLQVAFCEDAAALKRAQAGRGGRASERPIPAAEWQVQGAGSGASHPPSAAAEMHHSNAARPLAACTLSQVDQKMHVFGAWPAMSFKCDRIHPFPLLPAGLDSSLQGRVNGAQECKDL